MNKKLFKYSDTTLANLKVNSKHTFAIHHSMMLYGSNALYSLIPKNGCSTMRLSIAIANGCIDGINNGHWIHNNNDTFRASLSDAIRAKYKFVVLRCPFRRLASVFLDKFVAKEPEAWQYRENLGRSFNLDDLTFRSFTLSLKNPSILNSNIHWRKQVDFLIYNEYSDYYCLENFSDAVQTLKEKIGFEIHDARALTNHGLGKFSVMGNKNFADTAAFDIAYTKRHGECPDYSSMYDPEIIEVVKNLYADDIAFYVEKFGLDNLLFDV